ncbi:hypothetical protein ACFFP0_09990 [Rhizobium puerariae]|uniref:Uncharacterized protein n=1 Tax=Rhizobium puerariae TaxID=1585791 RepID=A0ABV6AGE8_9HYPH
MRVGHFGPQLRRFVMKRLMFWLLLAMVAMILAIVLLLPSQQNASRSQQEDGSIMWPADR